MPNKNARSEFGQNLRVKAYSTERCPARAAMSGSFEANSERCIGLALGDWHTLLVRSI